MDYLSAIPNNVGVDESPALQRALGNWQPMFLDWWKEMGPANSTDLQVYLRTAVSVDRDGWAKFAYVRMEEYRWGIFLFPKNEDRKISFGTHRGEAAWQEIPSEYRSSLRKIIVTQGDTEPASVEQQRLLGMTAPSLYDLRNLFQVNVEEGRHLWAMVYLLLRYFGADGREEAGSLLARRSGHPDNPRILNAFNEETSNWVSFFMFSFFTDRDGKFQLASLSESAFDPLARTCQFMLAEEAHHLFVGESGIARIIQRTCEAMQKHGVTDPSGGRRLGVIDLTTLQKFVNFHYSVTLDLFGSDVSSNAASFFSSGLKGRFGETKRDDDHTLEHDETIVYTVEGAQIREKRVSALSALNATLRYDYTQEIQGGLDRWNLIPERFGLEFRFRLPHSGFHRKIGNFAGKHITPQGKVIDGTQWNLHCDEWLPTLDDHAYIRSLMKRVNAPGVFADWIASPARGINGMPLDFEFVRFA